MSRLHFNAPEELQQIRQQKRLRQRKLYTQSRLNRYRAELVALRKAGASYRELVLWLRKNKRIKITHTSVMRYLDNLPELQEPDYASLP